MQLIPSESRIGRNEFQLQMSAKFTNKSKLHSSNPSTSIRFPAPASEAIHFAMCHITSTKTSHIAVTTVRPGRCRHGTRQKGTHTRSRTFFHARTPPSILRQLSASCHEIITTFQAAANKRLLLDSCASSVRMLGADSADWHNCSLPNGSARMWQGMIVEARGI